VSPTTTRPRPRPRPAGRSPARRRGRAPSPGRAQRRRKLAIGSAVLVGAVAALLIAGRGQLEDAVREITLPLRHDDIIRQQARDKNLDPALIAAVIYEESRFRDQTSHAGAKGLMQVTPETARFIARRSGGIDFVESDLSTPQVNISYGSYFLRYLIDRYQGDETLAIAAYNAGETHLNRWIEQAGGLEEFDVPDDIRFEETREYVENVRDSREQYRDRYAEELGLD
jgi:soluble lytic murein transglycosylase